MSDSSTMDDYDWLRPAENTNGCPGGYCHSRHDDTTLSSYLSVDAYVAATVYQSNWLALTALAGYKRDSQSWDASGGVANYTDFPSTVVTTYDQVWQAPYLGLQVNGDWNRWELQGRVIGSWWVEGQDRDLHHLRSLLFIEPFGESNMVGANAHVGYRLTRNLLLKAEYDLQQWQLAKGPSTEIDQLTGNSDYRSWNAAGAESITQTVSFGAVLEY
jgi:plasminogen activator